MSQSVIGMAGESVERGVVWVEFADVALGFLGVFGVLVGAAIGVGGFEKSPGSVMGFPLHKLNNLSITWRVQCCLVPPWTSRSMACWGMWGLYCVSESTWFQSMSFGLVEVSEVDEEVFTL